MKKKKALIIILALIALLTAAYFYFDNRNRTLSPPGKVTESNSGLTVSISYSRPSVRGRLIFGTEEQSALLPYGKYWRLGANESTQITFSTDVLFNGEEAKAGTYRMYAIPGQNSFEIGLNTAVGKWGYSEPNYELDILRTKVPVSKNSHIEQFTIRLESADGGIDVICEWSDVSFTIPVLTK
ncbi:MAG TPA: DUF2911 domain-containing protein [Chryseosolibacter sp.]|nr:DUF2911 domain-containing protein [Chryseosolibacter sp.]